ncbi:MAG: creatininase family protein [Anaerolineae bacterium]
MQKYQLFEMRRPEIEAALANGADTAVATFGATEQHGLHLPMGTDSIWGEELGLRVTQALGNALQAPGLRIGCSEHHMDFSGSLTLSNETFYLVVEDTCRSLAHHGFKNIVLIPTHGGNFRPIGAAAERIRKVLPDVNIIDYNDLMAFMGVLFGVAAEFGFTPEHTGGHAGENETSLILALRPELVDMSVAEAGYVGDMLSIAPTIMKDGFKGITENGVLGNPEGARPDIGEAYLKAMTADIVAHVKKNL